MAKKKDTGLSIEERLEQALIIESAQPYKIPDNWAWVKFGELAVDIADGPFGSNLKREHYTDNREVRIIQLSNIGEDGWRDENVKYTTFEHLKTISRSEVKAGEIVIAKMMPAGRGIIVPDFENAYVLSSDSIKFVPHNEINTKYILYALNSNDFRNQITANTQGITRARTSIGKLRTYAFPLPPLSEQQRIVERIENLFEKLDHAKELIQNALDSFENRKAAILHKACTGELTKKWREENGITLESWEESKLGKITNIKSSKRVYAKDYKDSGVPFYRSSEIVDLYDYGITNSKYFISEDLYQKLKLENGVPNEGDLLVTSVGTIGKTWIVDNRQFYYKDGNLTQVEQSDKLYIPFLQLFIDSAIFKEQIYDTVSGSAYNALTIVKFKNINILLPEIYEQKEIVNRVKQLIDKENIVDIELNDMIGKIEEMKKSILARAFRGELGTNDPTEESAIELLKGILSLHQ